MEGELESLREFKTSYFKTLAKKIKAINSFHIYKSSKNEINITAIRIIQGNVKSNETFTLLIL